MRRSPELMQFEIGISTRRYLPASGTAGFERSLVSGKRRVPAPPPMMMARVRSAGTLGRGLMLKGIRGYAGRRSDSQREFTIRAPGMVCRHAEPSGFAPNLFVP